MKKLLKLYAAILAAWQIILIILIILTLVLMRNLFVDMQGLII